MNEENANELVARISEQHGLKPDLVREVMTALMEEVPFEGTIFLTNSRTVGTRKRVAITAQLVGDGEVVLPPFSRLEAQVLAGEVPAESVADSPAAAFQAGESARAKLRADLNEGGQG